MIKRRMRLRRTAIITFIAIWAATIPAAAVAATDNMVPTQTYPAVCFAATQDNPRNVCQTDNANLVIYTQSSVSGEAESSVDNTLGNDFQPTDLTVSATGSPVYSGSGETDIIYQQGALTNSDLVGLTWCDDDVDGTTYACDQQYVRFSNNASINVTVACHETGHAVGLTHGQQAYPVVMNTDPVLGCMRSSANVNYYALGTNQKNNINATY